MYSSAYVWAKVLSHMEERLGAVTVSAWFDDAEAQRLFRDAHMTAAHAYTDYDISAQILGRALMGLEPDPSLF